MASRAHPRSRGENFVAAIDILIGAGSSPLTRGKSSAEGSQPLPSGLIPAHAGKMGHRLGEGGDRRAHPRSRGENAAYVGDVPNDTGSSPLTRGKSRSRRRCIGACRLIPAHAGKISPACSSTPPRRAHPRSRGENSWKLKGKAITSGSSPLTRGKLDGAINAVVNLGLIPAHAGKIRHPPRGNRHPEAHPRSRGENETDAGIEIEARGSSPLTRGKYFLTCAFIAQIGQILESRELCASSESYSLRNVYATAAPQDQVRSIGLVLPSSRGAS